MSCPHCGTKIGPDGACPRCMPLPPPPPTITYAPPTPAIPPERQIPSRSSRLTVWGIISLLVLFFCFMVWGINRAMVRAKIAAMSPAEIDAAFTRGDVEVYGQVLDVYPEWVQRTDTHKQTLLHRAARTGNTRMAVLLIDRGADLMARDKDQRTPLDEALMYRRLSIVALLLKRGANVNSHGNRGMIPLHAAARFGYVDGARILLQHGADVNRWDGDFNTPLHYATECGS